ncbi:probable xsa-associated protein [Xanthomonas albilineans GPE PC73]|uniref:Probable xsa-associated protein n=1 Tax=Xanthomonas albilineans (strain GPE PC73 / CFBP 7063) TaxID=380358 RepID=D2UAI6_XANAP|nr:putative xsa-associated protein [Xanthomonas albilineans]CBA15985.1 probable xsa-associated protein [Xanthomonas albilineans GPE PC73]
MWAYHWTYQTPLRQRGKIRVPLIDDRYWSDRFLIVACHEIDYKYESTFMLRRIVLMIVFDDRIGKYRML